jgi:hypothetical protein
MQDFPIDPGYNSASGAVARAIKNGFELCRAGYKVRASWAGRAMDEAELRQWFRDRLDQRINLKAGLRSDGAPLKTQCACKHCMGRCDCSRSRLRLRGGWVCGGGCRFPWGGRHWDEDWQGSARRDSRRLRDRFTSRIAIHSFDTELARKRFGHLIEPWPWEN